MPRRVPLHPRLSFQGRFGRKLFWQNWLGAIFLLGLSVALGMVLGRAGTAGEILGTIISVAGVIAAAWISLATQVKRWHDLDRSGWMVLLNFIPALGFFICVTCLGFLKGKPGPNRFDVKGVTVAPVDAPAAVPAPAGGEPPKLATSAPGRSKWPKRIFASVLGLLALVVLGGAGFFLVSPRADWETRRSWLRATMGSPTECQAMAWRYRAGRGLPQDFSKAAFWFQRAADKGIASAQYDLGVLYFYGLGVTADPVKARPLLEAAVRQDYVPAMTLLGLCHEAEEPGSATALTLWEQAADAGDPWAESLLGSACLAKRAEGDGKENLIRGLYWLETARRHGVETVGGLLQHVWATVPAEDLELVTGEVFGRLENGKPDPLPHEVAAPAPETAPPGDSPPPNEPAETAPGDVQLGAEVLAKVRSLPEYVTVSTLYAEKSQTDPNWPASDEGHAVGQYLQTMRTDAQSAVFKKGVDGKVVLKYSVGGNTVSDEGVRAEDIENNPEQRESIVTALAQNIVGAPRPMKVAEFLKQTSAAGGEGK